MPQIFKVGSIWVYFWANEGKPVEPIHVHAAKGRPRENGTKIWITENGKCLVASHNDSDISVGELKTLLRVIEANSDEIIEKWIEFFGEIRYFC